MRILLGIAVVAVLVVAAWASIPTDARQDGIVSIDPVRMMVNTTNLPPEVRYDQGTIFHDVQYDEGTN
jgi:hypothetical protein